MGRFSNFLINIWHNFKGWFSTDNADYSPVIYPSQTEPRRGVITKEPALGYEDGFLVMVLDHSFESIPSWVEWDAERKIFSIMQMAGEVDEVKVQIAPEHLKTLEVARKLLLVSNDNDNRIVHFVPYLART